MSTHEYPCRYCRVPVPVPPEWTDTERLAIALWGILCDDCYRLQEQVR